MRTTIKYILLTALRDWLFSGLFVALFLAYAVAVFLGGTALVEGEQMAASYIAGSSRLLLVIGLIVFVCFHVRRAFDNREIEVILSRPVSRSSFVIAYWLGFAVVSLILITVLTASIYLFLTVHSSSSLLIWSFSLVLELWLVVAFSLFASLLLRSAVVAVLLSFGFYFISRMLGFFLFVMESPLHQRPDFFSVVTGKLLEAVSAVLPRLDFYSKSEWLVHGVADDVNIMFFVMQTVIYIPFLLWMAIMDFKRRQF